MFLPQFLPHPLAGTTSLGSPRVGLDTPAVRPTDYDSARTRGLLGSIGLETRQEAAFQPVEYPDGPDRTEWFVYILSTVPWPDELCAKDFGPLS
jgi:hypothetical protein